MKIAGTAPPSDGDRTVSSTCYMCTADCGITVRSSGTEIVSVELPDCVRGGAMIEQRESPERLLHPEIRTSPGASWQRAEWDAALDHVAAKLRDVRERHGADSVAFAAGYTKEVRPYLQRLACLFGSPHYITETSCCFSSGFIAASVTLGKDYGYFLTPSRWNRPETRCRLVWSANPRESQLGYGKHYLLDDGSACPVILVDPRRTPLAERAAVHLRPRPGTDGALALGMAYIILKEGLEDAAFLEKHAHGLDAFREYVGKFAPSSASAVTGVPKGKLAAAARMYAKARPAQIHISPNATVHHSNGFQNHRAILLLAALTGNLDVHGGNRPWGHRLREKSVSLHREKAAGLPPQMGADRFPLFIAAYPEAQAMVLADAIESGKIRAVLSFGLNLMMWPNSGRLRDLLRKLELFTVCDFHATPTRDAATVSFPAATHLEREALVVSGSGTIRRRPAAVPPRGEARSDTDIVFALAGRLGLGKEFWNGSLADSFRERLEKTGLRLEDLGGDGSPAQIEIPDPPERAYERDGFRTPTGKVEFVSTTLEKAGHDGLPVYREPFWSPVRRPDLAKDYPLVLTTGGRSANYTHSQGRALPSLREREPEARVQINSGDAEVRGIRDGATVTLSSPLGSIRMRAWVTDVLPPGVVHAFHGWAGANVNELIPDEGLDPISGFPPFKSSLCQVAPAAE